MRWLTPHYRDLVGQVRFIYSKVPPREGYIDHLRSGYFGWVGFNIGSPPLTPGGYVLFGRAQIS